jgi:hypothetical protein
MGPTHRSGVLRGIHNIIAAQISTTSAIIPKSLLFISKTYHLIP